MIVLLQLLFVLCFGYRKLTVQTQKHAVSIILSFQGSSDKDESNVTTIILSFQISSDKEERKVLNK